MATSAVAAVAAAAPLEDVEANIADDLEVKVDGTLASDIISEIYDNLTTVKESEIPQMILDALHEPPLNNKGDLDSTLLAYNYYSGIELAQALAPVSIELELEIPFDIVRTIGEFIQLCIWDSKESNINKKSNIQIIKRLGNNNKAMAAMLKKQESIVSLNTFESENDLLASSNDDNNENSQNNETKDNNNNNNDTTTTKDKDKENDQNSENNKDSNKDKKKLSILGNECGVSYVILAKPNGNYFDSVFLGGWIGMELFENEVRNKNKNNNNNNNNNNKDKNDSKNENASNTDEENKDSNNNNNNNNNTSDDTAVTTAASEADDNDNKDETKDENKDEAKGDEKKDESKNDNENGDRPDLPMTNKLSFNFKQYAANSKLVYRYVFKYYGDQMSLNEKLFQIGFVTQDFKLNEIISQNGQINDGIGDCKTSLCWYNDYIATAFKHNFRKYQRQKAKLDLTLNNECRYFMIEINLLRNYINIVGPAINKSPFCRERLMKFKIPDNLKLPFKIGITMSAGDVNNSMGFGLVAVH